MTEWTLTRDQTATEENLFDVQYVDSANTFGDFLVAKVDDVNGTKFEQYPRGTRVDASVTPTDSTTSIDKFSGYVVERREINDSGADALEIEAYTFDQFLRRNKVSSNLSGQSIQSALETIITNDTPVAFNSGKVTVASEQTLSRSFRGVKVEDALIDLAFKSENEDFGVDDSLDFFFQPQEINHISRGIDDTNWFNYDIPELGKEVVNEVEVWYDNGNESVIIDDGRDKLDLQDSLGLSSPATQRAEITREKITTLSDAEDEGRKYLEFRNATLSGTVTTFGLFTAEPGDTININITSRGINSEFRIAEVDYRWGDDETILTIVEKRGDNDDVLLRLTDAVDRVEMRPADRDAPKNRITSTEATALVSTTTTYNSGTAIEADRFVNDGRNVIRDAWINGSVDPIDTLVIGDDAGNLSRSNTALENETGIRNISVSTSGNVTVSFSASGLSVTAEEIGLRTQSGKLVYRAVFDNSITLSDIEITFTVSDASPARSVITTAGQTAIRDILADNNPEFPVEYGYGSGDTLPSESDTTLQTQEKRQGINLIELESYDTTTEWENLISGIGDDVPLAVNNGKLEQLPVADLVEAENAVGGTTVSSSEVPGTLSNDQGAELNFNGAFLEQSFSFSHRVPDGDLSVQAYFTTDNFTGEIEYTFESTTLFTRSFNSDTRENDILTTGGTIDGDQAANDSFTFRIDVISYSSGSLIIDTLQAVDDLGRFSNINMEDFGSYDSTTQTYDAPTLYPDGQVVDTGEISSTIAFDTARLETTWQDNEVGSIGLSTDGTSYTTTGNETLETTFGSKTTSVFAQFGIDRYTADPNTTPSVGDATTAIDLATVFSLPDGIDIDAIGVALARVLIPAGEITGTVISEGGLFGESGSLLTRHVFAEFEVLSNQQIISAEKTQFTGEDS